MLSLIIPTLPSYPVSFFEIKDLDIADYKGSNKLAFIQVVSKIIVC